MLLLRGAGDLVSSFFIGTQGGSKSVTTQLRGLSPWVVSVRLGLTHGADEQVGLLLRCPSFCEVFELWAYGSYVVNSRYGAISGLWSILRARGLDGRVFVCVCVRTGMCPEQEDYTEALSASFQRAPPACIQPNLPVLT